MFFWLPFLCQRSTEEGEETMVILPSPHPNLVIPSEANVQGPQTYASSSIIVTTTTSVSGGAPLLPLPILLPIITTTITAVVVVFA